MSLLLHFDDEAQLAKALAGALGWPCAAVRCHHFPDGELKLTLPRVLLRIDTPASRLVKAVLHHRAGPC